MEYEIYHAGVPGMKWGVRKDRNGSSGGTSKGSPESTTKTTVKKRGDTTTITAKSGTQKAKLKVKRDKGAKLVAKSENTKIKVVVSNTANVTAGALRVAAAFVPGLSILNGVATAVSLAGTVATLKK